MFKVVLNDGSKIPDDKIVYIISKNGLFLKKKVGIVESLTKVGGVSFLQEIKPYAKLNIPKIPQMTFGKIMTFFRKVYAKYHAECNAILYYHEAEKKFRIVIPPQEVSGTSVSYIRIPSMKGYVRLSTIHSHPGFAAFHSSTDTKDEKDSDGLHITVGEINKSVFDIAAAIVVGGTRFKVDPLDYIDGIQMVQVRVEPKSVITYRSSYISHLFKEELGDVATTEPTYEEGYKFTKWIKKFERCNPKWMTLVQPEKEVVSTFEWGKWNEDLKGFESVVSEVHDSLPKVVDIKQERRDEKDIDPCGRCPFKSFKGTKEKTEEKTLIEDCYGI